LLSLLQLFLLLLASWPLSACWVFCQCELPELAWLPAALLNEQERQQHTATGSLTGILINPL
jgi:hypothetical protein